MRERDRNIALRKKERRIQGTDTSRAPFHGADISVVMAYPNRYWIAMSNLGFQTIYRLLDEEKRFAVERAYIPEDESSECRTFESDTKLSNADLIAVSVSFETDYPSVLQIVESAGIPLESRLELRGAASISSDDGWSRPFILGGGASLTLNPEPLANFFDAILIGEGEEAIREFTAVYIKSRDEGVSFSELLERISQIDGFYVPSLYTVKYGPTGEISAFERKASAPARVQRRFIKNLDAFPTFTTIQTPETEFKAMFMTETGRGCEVGCRFCVAGYMYRPTRKRSRETIAETIQVGVETSQSVGFVGAAVSSHPAIAELARSVAESGKRAALSSIMSQRVTPDLASSLSESEYKTVALAPEAGSEALRFRVGKRVCDEQIISAVATLAREGIRHFKLYFMVGLPSETLEDVADIPKLVERAREAAMAAAREQEDFRIAPTIFLSVNPFIPKAWTPFQRHPFLGLREAKRRIEIVQQAVRRMPNVDMKFESPRESYFQALMSRGDRRVGDLLIKMRKEKNDWRWIVRHGDEELLEGVPPVDFYVLREIAAGETLPWEVVDLKIKRSLLEREYARTFDEDVIPIIARVRGEFLGNGISELC